MFTGLRNANMTQKSAIQVILEQNSMLESLKQSIRNLVEEYTINGNVFGLHNGTPTEFNTGYFAIECEKDNLQDAIREMNTLDKCIRIVENKKFQVGSVHSYLNECALGCAVIDIETQTIIER